MQKNEPLFDLIKSMNNNEKRYFQLFASRHTIGEKNNYVKLFDAINKQKEYNEKALIKSFANTPIVKNFSFNKYYLYKLILKSLNAFHSGSSVATEIKELLHSANILFEKGLLSQCEKLADKARELALKYNKHVAIIEVLSFDIKLATVQSYSKKTIDDINAIYDTITRYSKLIDNEMIYRRINSVVFYHLSRQGIFRATTEEKTYQEVINSNYLNDESQALSFHAKYYFNQSKLVINRYLKNDHKNAYVNARAQVDIYEKNPEQIEDSLNAYIVSLHNLSICEREIGMFNDALKTNIKMRALKPKSELEKNHILYATYNSDLDIYLSTGEFQKALVLIDELQKAMDSEIIIFNKEHQTILYYTIGCVFFAAKKFKESKKYLNKIINNEAPNLKHDVQCFARIINLLVHYELGDQDMLEYTVKSTYRFLSKRNRLYKFETLFLNFIKNKAPKLNTDQERIQAFSILKDEINKLTENSIFESKVLEYFDFITYLESKINKKDFGDLIKEKSSLIYKKFH